MVKHKPVGGLIKRETINQGIGGTFYGKKTDTVTQTRKMVLVSIRQGIRTNDQQKGTMSKQRLPLIAIILHCNEL